MLWNSCWVLQSTNRSSTGWKTHPCPTGALRFFESCYTGGVVALPPSPNAKKEPEVGALSGVNAEIPRCASSGSSPVSAVRRSVWAGVDVCAYPLRVEQDE